MKRWMVISPVYNNIPGFGWDSYYEPPEPTRDVVEVEARSRKEAIIAGAEAMREQCPNGYFAWIGSDEPFLTGFCAEIIPPSEATS